jgi:hypothetical protein
MEEGKTLRSGVRMPVFRNILVCEVEDIEIPELDNDVAWNNFLVEKMVEYGVEIEYFVKYTVLARWKVGNRFQLLWKGVVTDTFE